MDNGQCTLDNGNWALDKGQWICRTMDNRLDVDINIELWAIEPLESGHLTTNNGHSTMNTGQYALDDGHWQMDIEHFRCIDI